MSARQTVPYCQTACGSGRGKSMNPSEKVTAIDETTWTVSLPRMVRIPGGHFWMGCATGRADEQPVHRVQVDPFSMGATTVTNQEYLQFVQETGRQMPVPFGELRFSHPRQPVVAVTWFEAVAYCDWLTRTTGQPFRLPTEAEWEWAIRAGAEGRLYAWGDEIPATFEFYRTGWRDERPHPVAQGKPNAYGLYDLGDNVHEWCLDWYDPDYYARSPFRNPANLQSSGRRASRGGSWRHQIKASRCAARSSLSPNFAYTDYGFRVVSSKLLHDWRAALDCPESPAP